MSDRPTISVYINGKIVDIGCYRNWSSRCVFIEAVAIAALYCDCTSAEQYRLCKFGTAEEIQYNLDPKEFDGNEEFLKFIEQCSESPTIIDITSKSIYMCYNDPPLSTDDLNAIPSIFDSKLYFGNLKGLKKGVTLDETEKLLYLFTNQYEEFDPLNDRHKHKLPFDKIDMERVLHLIYELPDLRENISAETSEGISKKLSDNAAQ